jgi:hypothetical protein
MNEQKPHRCRICDNKMSSVGRGHHKSNVCKQCQMNAPEHVRCKGVTQKKTRCCKFAKYGDYCEHHVQTQNK